MVMGGGSCLCLFRRPCKAEELLTKFLSLGLHTAYIRKQRDKQDVWLNNPCIATLCPE